MKFKAETMDKLQYLFKVYKFNDRHLHCVIDLENNLKHEILLKAVQLSIEVVPIIGCKYVEEEKCAFWQKVNSIKPEDILVSTDSKVDFEKFITSETDLFHGPQVKFCILNGEKKSLAVIMNHMVSDAAGFKQYLYLVCNIYSEILKNPSYVITLRLHGSRSLNRVINKFTNIEKMKLLLAQNKESNKDSEYIFPMSAKGNIKPFIATFNIDKDRFINLKQYCKKNNATINDVILAAYYRVLCKLIHIEENKKLNVPIMVDMRRYLENKDIDAICNIVATAGVSIEHSLEDDFETTLTKISKCINSKKDNYMGMNAILKISLSFKLLSYNQAKKILAKKFKNPLIAMTNIGILDSKKLYFSGNNIKSAYMCGSIKYPPYFQLAVTSFKDTLTFSVNLYGDDVDEKNINDFLALVGKELPN